MKLKATNRTPEVDITENTCLIAGECYPENIAEFASPIFSNLRTCLDKADAFEVRIHLFYFNSSSAKFLFDLFDLLDESAKGGKEILIRWLYRSDDDSMQEAGEDFLEDVEYALFELESVINEE